MKLKTAEEYISYYHDNKMFLHNLIQEIIADAQAEIDALKASQLQPLPEEMPKDLPDISIYAHDLEALWNWFRQRYGTPWWANLKEGDRFFDEDGINHHFESFRLVDTNGFQFNPHECRPYTGPTVESILAKLEPEERAVIESKIKEGGK